MATLKQCNRCGATRDWDGQLSDAVGWSDFKQSTVVASTDLPPKIAIASSRSVDLCPECSAQFTHWLGVVMTGKPK